MSATYAKVVREALPHAIVILDRLHLVALANRAVTDYRRESGLDQPRSAGTQGRP